MEFEVRQRLELIERRLAAIEAAIGTAIGMAQDLQSMTLKSGEVWSARSGQLSESQGELALLGFEVHALLAAAGEETRQRAAVNATLYVETTEPQTFKTDPEHWIGFRRLCSLHLPEVRLPEAPTD